MTDTKYGSGGRVERGRESELVLAAGKRIVYIVLLLYNAW